ncbi:MAG: protein kinase [Polyangiales bacterium]
MTPSHAPAGRPYRCPNCGELFSPGALRCPRDGALLGERADPLLGAVLAGRYRIAGRLGRGGMSLVYLARHVVIDRLAAVKVLRRDLSADPAQRERFLREAQAVNRIQHENIVDVTDYGETSDGVVYLVMEYLPGESLLGAICSGTLPVLRALDIARQIAAGVGHAHEMRVVHRDLKPDNVLLVPRPRGREIVKVLDFGVAKVLDEPSLTLNRRVFGTPGYIAPEYAAGVGLSTRSDLYAIGVMLYEMVTGALPHEASHPGEMLLRAATEPPIPPRDRVPTLPVEVEAIILKCLQKSPDARHRDAFHLIEDLDEARRRLRLDPAAAAAPSWHGVALSGSLHVPGVLVVEDAPTRVQEALDEDTTRRTVPTSSGSEPPLASAVPPATAYWEGVVASLRARAAAQFWGDEVARELDALEETLRALADASDRAELDGVRLLGMEARGREMRHESGRAKDELAAALSGRARAVERVLARRASLAGRLAKSEDELSVWELAACDHLLGELDAEREELAAALASRDLEIEAMNAALEQEHAALRGEFAGHVEAQRRALRALREGAARIEARIGATGPRGPAEQPR